MAGSGKKWFIGCGIGCGMILLIIGGIGACGYFGFQKIKKEADLIEASFETLADVYGQPSEFVPSADGTISADRMETFLSVRDSLVVPIDDLGTILRNLDGVDEFGNETTISFITRVRSGIQLVPSLMAFLAKRNQILSGHAMSMGEYLYIYSAGYYVMLDNDLADGPSFNLNDNRQEHGDGPITISMSDHEHGDVRESRVQQIRENLHDMLLAQARNQVQALKQDAGNASSPEQAAWLAEVEAEILKMEQEELRLLWEEGLPAPLLQSLEPYRERLIDTYDSWVNPVETSSSEHQ